MHILVLPKWYPGRNDPQLGEFIRNHAVAAGRYAQLSVLFLHASPTVIGEPEIEIIETQGVWEMRVYYRSSTASLGLLRKGVNLLRFLKSFKVAAARLESERGVPDLCHVHIMVRPVIMALWARTRIGIPFIISEQSSEYVDGKWQRKHWLFRSFNRWAFSKAAETTVVSPWLQKAMVNLKIPGAHHVIPNVLPVDQVQAASQGNAMRALMVADMVDATKNISGVLRAIAKCNGQGVSLSLELIGGGPDEDMLKAMTKELGLTSQVEFHGRLPNTQVLKIMSSTGFVIINSNVETFSVVTGEALALGKPVIATRCGGPEALVTKQNGIMVDPKNDDQLASAIKRMTQEHGRYAPADVRKTVADRFSSAAVGEQFHQLYKRVLNG